MAFLDVLYQDWRTIAVLAAAGSVLISVAVIMLARLFDMKSLEQAAKAEFVYAASTVFIVLFVVGMIGFGDTVLKNIMVQMYVNTITACPPAQAAAAGSVCSQLQQAAPTLAVNVATLPDLMTLYMDGPAKCSQQFLDYMYYAAIPIDTCSSVYMEVYMSEQLTCFGLKWASERITNGVQILTFYMFAYYLIGHAMQFVKYYAGFFFSLGVALRAFPPSRGGGAYLMALSVGLYFVLPFSYVLISSIAMSYTQSNFFVANGVTQTAAGTTIQYACNTPAIGDVSDLGCGTGSMAKQGELMGWLEASKTNITDFFTFQLPALTQQMASVMCIFPFIAFAIFFTFVLNTTSLFGGNIPEIGRGLVKLI